MNKPLNGIKVLDLTRVLAGPYASMILGDLGAEIIKIENPSGGDDARGFGPFVNGESIYFISINRNKKSLTLNLKTDEGKEIFLQMVKDADIVLENYRPGTMEKLGLGYEELERINPKIIYAASSGFGHTGPYSEKAAYDLIVQGMGGIMSLTGSPGGAPTRVGASIGDITAGLYTAIGILSALHNRRETGKGQKVDVAMLDCQVAILENAIARYAASGTSPAATGNRHPSITPFAALEASNGYIVVAAGNDKLWAKLCAVLGIEDLIEDPRFRTNEDRTSNWGELENILQAIMQTRSVEDWSYLLEEEGIPSGPINDIQGVVENPQIVSREMIIHQEHPIAGTVMIPGVPIKLSKTPGSVETSAPLLGEHSATILSQMGYALSDIQSLKEKGVI